MRETLSRIAAALAGALVAGEAVGLALAARELAQQHYLAQGLWRTALFEVGAGAVLGCCVGLVAGAALLGVIWLSQRAIREDARTPLHLWGQRYVPLLILLSGAAVMLAPRTAGHGVGLSYRVLLPLSFAVMWLVLAGVGVWNASRSGADREEGWFLARWTATVAIGFVLAFLHLWTRGFRPLYLGLFCGAALVGCVALGFALRAPARLACDRAAKMMERFPRATRTRLALLALASVPVLGVAGVAPLSRAQAAARTRGRNVILIGLDTLRADRTNLLSRPEGGRDLTPNLRRLAERGRVFTGAVAQSSWTLPSFASIFTGLYPEQHGAEHLTSTLALDQATLAELLREAGYRTTSVVSCEYLNAASGMGQGFQLLDESQVRGHRAVTSKEVTDRAIGLLEANRGRPFFLFAHYFDPHFCYEDHREYTFADWYRGWLRGAVENADQNAFCWMIGALGPAFANRSKATAQDRRFLADSYDEEVAYTDAQVGRLLDYVGKRGLWDSTMVIVVGDHGEELLERNYSGHSNTLYREQIDVPLVVAAPGVAPRSVEPRATEARAVFPTILQFLGASGARRMGDQGSLLAPRSQPAMARSSTRPVAEAPRAGEFIPKYVWLTTITDGRWKLIKDHLRGSAALYDLRSDPGETRDCSREHPEQRRKLERALDELDARVSGGVAPAPRTQADEEQKRRLKALGYL